LLAATGDPRTLALRAVGQPLDVPVYPEAGELTTTGRGELTENPRLALHADDVVFPVLHGTYGEDGTMQGLLELADIAYVGPGTLGSAVGMDKDVTKRLLAQAGIPVVPWRLVRAREFLRDRGAAVAHASGLGFPAFVKPANAGSSVGVSKVTSAAGMESALRSALSFDSKVLVEVGVSAREIECAVLGNDDPEASVPAEIVVHHKDGFYSYAAKYVDADGADAKIPADLPPELSTRVRKLAVDTFRCLELSGMARVDFFLERQSSSLFVNEVNTIPGFTAISMYPKMWEAAGVSQKELISRLIDLAIERRRIRRKLKTEM
jgi:D-alanine-D-alanine ligase